MSEATEHFERAIHRAEIYDSGMMPETHIAKGLAALSKQIDRIEQLLNDDAPTKD